MTNIPSPYTRRQFLHQFDDPNKIGLTNPPNLGVKLGNTVVSGLFTEGNKHALFETTIRNSNFRVFWESPVDPAKGITKNMAFILAKFCHLNRGFSSITLVREKPKYLKSMNNSEWRIIDFSWGWGDNREANVYVF